MSHPGVCLYPCAGMQTMFTRGYARRTANRRPAYLDLKAYKQLFFHDLSKDFDLLLRRMQAECRGSRAAFIKNK